jgi:Flp pilus assembly protein CpaB
MHPGGPSTSPVVAALTDLPAGAEITEDDLKLVELSTASQWGGLTNDPTNYFGKVLAHSIASNQPITDSDLLGPQLLAGLDPSLVAVSIPVANGNVTSLLHTGDLIDIYASSSDVTLAATLVAHAARVLALPKDSGSGVLSTKSASESIIVAINSGEVQLVASNSGFGNFTYALLPQS